MIKESILEYLGEKALHKTVNSLAKRRAFVGCLLWNRSKPVRVSFAALLRILDGDRYLLVQNRLRPEIFGPFGGAYKVFSEARRDLDSYEFYREAVKSSDPMEDDLRGFLPRKYLSKLVTWYQSGANRENGGECLRRELAEELDESSLELKPPPTLRFRLVREVWEGPGLAPGQEYTQFRIFGVYDLAAEAESSHFQKLLLKTQSRSRRLVLASSYEIWTGRTEHGKVIGHHAGYLLGKKRVRPDELMFK